MTDRKTADPEISVVIPVYNEAENLKALEARLFPALDGLKRTYEVIFTNDGSRDRSDELLRAIHAAHPSVVRVILFHRNYGQHMAIIAGFERARGKTIVTLDADLQNPPEEIGKLMAAIDLGHDVVGSYRRDRQDTFFRTYASRFINAIRAYSTGIVMRDHGCMLRAYSRDIVRQIVESDESSTYIPALAQYFASNPAEVEVEHAERAAGVSKYNLYKLARLNFDLMTGFTLLPLQLFTMLGLLLSGLSGLLVVVLAIRRIVVGPEAEGLFTLFGILFFLVSVVIAGLGIIGEYVGRIWLEVRQRPRYVVRETIEPQPNAGTENRT